MSSTTSEYAALIQSLEIPTGVLPPRSRRTPELEVLAEIRRRFHVPAHIETRAPLVSYLSTHIPLDDFFSFLGFLIKPFARMVVEIYDFLSWFEHSAASPQTVTEIRIGSRTAFPVNLNFMPRDLVKMLLEVSESEWDFDALGPLHNLLPPLYSIARCDGKYGADECRPDCFQHCREGVAKIARDAESVLSADDRAEEMAKLARTAGVDALTGVLTSEGADAAPRLHSGIRESLHEFIAAYGEAGKPGIKFASDCLPPQRRGIPPHELYSQKRILDTQQVFDRARTEVKSLKEEIQEFLRLPYWRRRNDLYEIWVLAKLCGQFPRHRIQLLNVHKRHWRIPGNGQGKIDEPVLRLKSPAGTYQVFTGLHLKGFQHPAEKTGRAHGAMPDWLFCREVDTFNFALFNDEGRRFASRRLVPELIVECKAGASYGLSETVERTMKERYLPLLRTPRGRSLLVNYRPFHMPAGLDSDPSYRDSIKQRYRQIQPIDALAPGEADAEEEFLRAVRDVFGLSGAAPGRRGGAVDLMLVIDTTASMRHYLFQLKEGWAECARSIADEGGDVRLGVVAVGDHGDTYDVLLSPLDANVARAVSFLEDVSATNGGDTAEAYEDALSVLNALPWRADAAKLVAFVGDAFPHPPGECRQGVDWNEELELLKGLGVRINGLRYRTLLQQGLPDLDQESETFFNRICAETGGGVTEVNSGADALDSILGYVLAP